MKRIEFICFIIIVFVPTGIFAQVSPKTVRSVDAANNNSIISRATQLERIKKDANKLRPKESTKEREIRFAQIKKDFEQIQDLQDSIIEAYTKNKRIDYTRISKSAAEMRKNAFQLNENLFWDKSEHFDEKIKPKNDIKEESVRDLIINLDNAIGNFVSSPIFQNIKIVDSEVSKKAQIELKKIIILSNSLFKEAEKMK